MFDRRGIFWPLEIEATPEFNCDRDLLIAAVDSLSGEGVKAICDDALPKILVGGCDDSELEVSLLRLEAKLLGALVFGAPQLGDRLVIGRESTADANSEGEGDGDRYLAWVKLSVKPIDYRIGFQIDSRLPEGVVSDDLLPVLERGLVRGLDEGLWRSISAMGVQVSLLKAEHDPEDKAGLSLAVAAAVALRAALENASPTLVWPFVSVEVILPDAFAVLVQEDLERRLGEGVSSQVSNGVTRITAQVPAAQLMGYKNTLAAMTEVQGTYSVRFSHYAPVPVVKGDGSPPSEPKSAALRA